MPDLMKGICETACVDEKTLIKYRSCYYCVERQGPSGSFKKPAGIDLSLYLGACIPNTIGYTIEKMNKYL